MRSKNLFRKYSLKRLLIFCNIPKKLKTICQNEKFKCILYAIETVGGTSVSSGCWGEDSSHGLAGAVHSYVASPALNIKIKDYRREDSKTCGFFLLLFRTGKSIFNFR
jgi:hypothetical protein